MVANGHHLSLWKRKCVICRQYCADDHRETYVAVFGDKSYTGWLGPFGQHRRHPLGHSNHSWKQYERLYLQGDQKQKPRNMIICRQRTELTKDPCSDCEKSPKSYLAHHICLSEHMSYQTLWKIGHALTPWFPSAMEQFSIRPSQHALEVCWAEGMAKPRPSYDLIPPLPPPGPPPPPGFVPPPPGMIFMGQNTPIPPRAATRRYDRIIEFENTVALVRRILDLPSDLFSMIVCEYGRESALARLGIGLTFTRPIRQSFISAPSIKFASCRNLWDPMHYQTDTEELNTRRTKELMIKRLCFTYQGRVYQPFTTAGTIDAHWTIRVRIDHLGIRSIEVLKEHPRKRDRPRHQGSFYVVECIGCASKNLTLFSQGPFMRLKPNRQHALKLWDTDNPPACGDYQSVGCFATEIPRIKTLEFKNATGITVFCTYNNTWAIHVHENDNTANKTWRQLGEEQQQECFWLYMPLKKHEFIKEAWIWEIRRSTGAVKGRVLQITSTSTGRSMIFGALNRTKPYTAHALTLKSRLTCLYHEVPSLPNGTSTNSNPISWFAVRSTQPIPNSEAPTLTVPERIHKDNYAHQSASLRNIASVLVMYDTRGATTGLLLTYANSNSACVGQYRLGHPDTQSYTVLAPAKIYIWHFSIEYGDRLRDMVSRECVRVRFLAGGDEEKEAFDEARESSLCYEIGSGNESLAWEIRWEVGRDRDRVVVRREEPMVNLVDD